MDEPYKKWLTSLEVGDTVIVSAGGFGCTTYTPSKITKVTPKGGLRVKGYTGILFKNGHVSSRGRDASYTLREPTNELVDSINLSRMRKYLSNVDWGKVDGGIVRQVRELLR